MAVDAGTAFLDVEAKLDKLAAGLETEGAGLFSAFGKKAGLLMIGGIGAAVGGGALLIDVGEKFEKAFDTIRVQTGKTGEELHGLDDTFKNVLTDVPASFGNASEAVAGLSQRLGLTGEPLRKMSDQMLNLSRITKTDLKTDVTVASQLFNNFGIAAADQGPKLDELFRASQATGVSVADLSSTMASKGAVFRQLGFTFEDSASMLALLNKAGVDAGPVMMSMSKAIATAAKHGEDAGTVFRNIFDGIRNGTSTTEDAIKIFGARAGPQLYGLIHDGKLSYEELAKSIGSGGDTINKAAEDTMRFGERWDLLKNRVFVAMEPVATHFLELVTKGFENLINIGGTVASDLGAAWDVFAGWFSGQGSDTIVGGSQKWTDAIGMIGDRARAVFDRYLVPLVDFIRDNWHAVLGGAAAVVLTIIVPAFASWAVAAATAAVSTLLAAAPFIAIAAAAFGLGYALVYAYEHSERFRQILDRIVSFFKTEVIPWVQKAVAYIVEQFSHLVAAVRARWDDIVVAVRNVFTALKIAVAVGLAPMLLAWSLFHDQILSVLSAAWDEIRSLIEAALKVVTGIIDVVLGVLSGDWGRAWDGIKEILAGVWDAIAAQVRFALNIVGNLISAGLTLVAAIFTGAWDAITSGVGAAWSAITGTISSAMSGAWNTVTGVFNSIVNYIGGLPGQMANAASGLWDWLSGGLRGALDAVIGLLNQGIDFINQFGIHVHIHDPIPGLPNIDFDWQSSIPHIPTLHAGGVFMPGGAGEGLALLKANEVVFTPDQLAALQKASFGLAASAKPGNHIDQLNLNLQSDSPPKEWLDEGLWRVVSG